MDLTSFFDLVVPLSERIDISILVVGIGVLILSFIPKIEIPIEKLTKFFMLISVFALIALTLIVSYDVIARKLWHGGSIAMQEFEWHLFDIVFLFSIAYTLSHDKHVRVDIFYDKFSNKTKAVISVPMWAAPKMDELMAICKIHNIILIEDAAQSLGASYKGRKLGTFGEMGTF